MAWQRKRVIKLLFLMAISIGIPFMVLELSRMEVIVLHAGPGDVPLTFISTKSDGRGLLGTLYKGQSAHVVACEVDKDGHAYRVRIDGDDREAYVGHWGSYFLERQRISLSNLDKVAFSCKELLDSIAESCRGKATFFCTGVEPVAPALAPVSDEKTAIAIAEAMLFSRYGENRTKREHPFRATLDNKGIWTVPEGYKGAATTV